MYIALQTANISVNNKYTSNSPKKRNSYRYRADLSRKMQRDGLMPLSVFRIVLLPCQVLIFQALIPAPVKCLSALRPPFVCAL